MTAVKENNSTIDLPMKARLPNSLIMRSVPVAGEESLSIARAYDGIADFLLLDSYKVRWRRNEYRSVFCDQSAIEMRSHARLPRAEFTLLSRSGTASRTSDGEYLFWSDYFFHQNHCVLSFCDN